MRVALVCSWLNQYGGAERVLEAVHDIWPDAPLYTSIHDAARLPAAWRQWDIRPSWMNRLPGVSTHHRPYLPVYAAAFETMRLRGYDVVLDVSSGFATAARAIGAPHVSYCLTPPRFLWSLQGYVEREGLHGWQARLLAPLLAGLRAWDRRVADRIDRFIAISREVQGRIAAFYGRESPIIYPPVDTARLNLGSGRGDYFLIISRLIPYKRIDLAIEAANRLRLPLKIVGEGRARPELERLAGPTVEFRGRLPDDEAARLLADCRAFIFPGLEDFGITPLESQAAGRPVVAFAAGGALETVVDGETGVLFPEQTVDSLVAAIHRLDALTFDPQRLRQNALRFDKAIFQAQLREYVEGVATEAQRTQREQG
ncbi:MAG: glycosyltransferase [Anaerolineae bacterium]